MSSEDESVRHLLGLGLNEKEAQLYFHLLKYGPTTSSSLAKALSVDLEDIHRTLTALIEEDIVRPSLSSPTMYVAVELSIVLEAAMQRRASELQDMEAREQELREYSYQHPLHPSADLSTFKMLRNIREIASVALSTLSLNRSGVLVDSTQGGAIFLLHVRRQQHRTRAVRTRGMYTWHNGYYRTDDTARARAPRHRRGRTSL